MVECYWTQNTEAALALLREACEGVAVIPLASIESHGPHLSLGNDTHCIEYLMGLVIRTETVAVLPTGAIHLRCLCSDLAGRHPHPVRPPDGARRKHL